MTSATRTTYHTPPAFVGSPFTVPPTNWAEILTPLFAEIDRQSRRAAREEYELLLAEQAEAAAEADRNDEVLTAPQVAAIFQMREQTVYEWFKSDKLKGYKVGRAVRFKRGEVMAALKAQTKPDGRRKYARRAATNKKSR